MVTWNFPHPVSVVSRQKRINVWPIQLIYSNRNGRFNFIRTRPKDVDLGIVEHSELRNEALGKLDRKLNRICLNGNNNWKTFWLVRVDWLNRLSYCQSTHEMEPNVFNWLFLIHRDSGAAQDCSALHPLSFLPV